MSKDIAEGKPIAAALKHIANQLKDHPEQRCGTVQKCVEEVRGGSSVYIFVC